MFDVNGTVLSSGNIWLVCSKMSHLVLRVGVISMLIYVDTSANGRLIISLKLLNIKKGIFIVH